MKQGNFYRVDLFANYGVKENSIYINKGLMVNFSSNLFQKATLRSIKLQNTI